MGCCSFIFGIFSIGFFISIIRWISVFSVFVYFCIGAMVGFLLSLEEPRPPLTNLD